MQVKLWMIDFWCFQNIEKTEKKFPSNGPESCCYSSRTTYNSKLDTPDKFMFEPGSIVQKSVQSKKLGVVQVLFQETVFHTNYATIRSPLNWTVANKVFRTNKEWKKLVKISLVRAVILSLFYGRIHFLNCFQINWINSVFPNFNVFSNTSPSC